MLRMVLPVVRTAGTISNLDPIHPFLGAFSSIYAERTIQPCRGWMTVSDAFLALCVLVERLITPLFYYLVIVSQDSIAAQV